MWLISHFRQLIAVIFLLLNQLKRNKENPQSVGEDQGSISWRKSSDYCNNPEPTDWLASPAYASFIETAFSIAVMLNC